MAPKSRPLEEGGAPCLPSAAATRQRAALTKVAVGILPHARCSALFFHDACLSLPAALIRSLGPCSPRCSAFLVNSSRLLLSRSSSLSKTSSPWSSPSPPPPPPPSSSSSTLESRLGKGGGGGGGRQRRSVRRRKRWSKLEGAKNTWLFTLQEQQQLCELHPLRKLELETQIRRAQGDSGKPPNGCFSFLQLISSS